MRLPHGHAVSRHLNDDRFVIHDDVSVEITSMTIFQSRLQDDDSMMIVSIETHGICCVRASRVKEVCERVVLKRCASESC
jgi:hypothetical protein